MHIPQETPDPWVRIWNDPSLTSGGQLFILSRDEKRSFHIVAAHTNLWGITLLARSANQTGHVITIFDHQITYVEEDKGVIILKTEERTFAVVPPQEKTYLAFAE